MEFDGESTIGRRQIKLTSDSKKLANEGTLCIPVSDMFENGEADHDIKFVVSKWQRCPDRLHEC